jgi:hypothetical protein
LHREKYQSPDLTRQDERHRKGSSIAPEVAATKIRAG